MRMNDEVRRNETISTSKGIHVPMRAPHIDKTAISPYDCYCDGYGMPGAYGNGYLAALKVSAGMVKKADDQLIDGIVAYDRAEINDAYVGQINMLTASSFCGLAGQIWGYDVARHDQIANGSYQPLYKETQFDGSSLPIYDAKPLLDASLELFGSEKERRFHLLPGAHTICANKGVTTSRPKKGAALKPGQAYGVWSYIAISFAKDRDYAADLFIEDAGCWVENDNEEDLLAFLDAHRKSITRSVVQCGQDSHVLFDRTYIAYAHCILKPETVGTAITVGPYFSLARDAVPAEGFGSLNDITLGQWLQKMKFKALSESMRAH